ncbi:MAG TPA: GrpB family protein [Mycobacteriales bacterium]|nr:GrpB family protein [Mycobacteriales bacterium]HWA68002.1 GrpB family protein [Mycobacteriales bacterium]
MATAEDITRHHEPDPAENPWVVAPEPEESVEIVEYDARWPARFDQLAGAVRRCLGECVLELEHVGSTAVPGLAAKDVIDLDLVVADPSDEAAYVPALEAGGWQLRVREPSWHQHRLLRFAEPRANLHVFGPDCPEVVRHLMFRDWLRSHPADREQYEQAKRAAVPGGGNVMDYNARKQPVVREIYDRMFRAAGLLD